MNSLSNRGWWDVTCFFNFYKIWTSFLYNDHMNGCMSLDVLDSCIFSFISHIPIINSYASYRTCMMNMFEECQFFVSVLYSYQLQFVYILLCFFFFPTFVSNWQVFPFFSQLANVLSLLLPLLLGWAVEFRPMIDLSCCFGSLAPKLGTTIQFPQC